MDDWTVPSLPLCITPGARLNHNAAHGGRSTDEPAAEILNRVNVVWSAGVPSQYRHKPKPKPKPKLQALNPEPPGQPTGDPASADSPRGASGIEALSPKRCRDVMKKPRAVTLQGCHEQAGGRVGRRLRQLAGRAVPPHRRCHRQPGPAAGSSARLAALGFRVSGLRGFRAIGLGPKAPLARVEDAAITVHGIGFDHQRHMCVSSVATSTALARPRRAPPGRNDPWTRRGR